MQGTDHLFESDGNRDVPAGAYPAAVADILALLDTAERVGLRSGRAMRLRSKLERGFTIDAERMAAMEQWLRDWLARHEAVRVFELGAAGCHRMTSTSVSATQRT